MLTLRAAQGSLSPLRFDSVQTFAGIFKNPDLDKKFSKKNLTTIQYGMSIESIID
jgi:hypothetical protein